MDNASLEAKGQITRTDISKLLASIGPPGKKREEKLKVIQELELKNNQGHGVELTLDSYSEW